MFAIFPASTPCRACAKFTTCSRTGIFVEASKPGNISCPFSHGGCVRNCNSRSAQQAALAIALSHTNLDVRKSGRLRQNGDCRENAKGREGDDADDVIAAGIADHERQVWPRALLPLLGTPGRGPG